MPEQSRRLVHVTNFAENGHRRRVEDDVCPRFTRQMITLRLKIPAESLLVSSIILVCKNPLNENADCERLMSSVRRRPRCIGA